MVRVGADNFRQSIVIFFIVIKCDFCCQVSSSFIFYGGVGFCCCQRKFDHYEKMHDFSEMKIL